jgi:(+)-pinoresinol hydroxylase
MKMWHRLIATAVASVALSAGAEAASAADGSASKLAHGERVFNSWCATCHSSGAGMPGTQALQAKYNGSPPALLLERTDLTAQQIAFFVRNGVSVMAQFRKTEVSDADLEALTTYIVTTAKAKRPQPSSR